MEINYKKLNRKLRKANLALKEECFYLQQRNLNAEDYKTKRIQELEKELLIRNNKIDSLQKDIQSLEAENDRIASFRQDALSEISSFKKENEELKELLVKANGSYEDICYRVVNRNHEIAILKDKLSKYEKTT